MDVGIRDIRSIQLTVRITAGGRSSGSLKQAFVPDPLTQAEAGNEDEK